MIISELPTKAKFILAFTYILKTYYSYAVEKNQTVIEGKDSKNDFSQKFKEAYDKVTSLNQNLEEKTGQKDFLIDKNEMENTEEIIILELDYKMVPSLRIATKYQEFKYLL